MTPSLVLVGNAPSSGSTFFADLLDSTPWSACGPELNLFASRAFYRTELSPAKRLGPNPCAAVYVRSNELTSAALPAYGLTRDALDGMLSAAPDVASFCARFVGYYLAFRDRDPGGVVFEKTPQNLGCLEDFLDAVPGASFVHVVRHPAFVYLSLRRRFSPRIARWTWLVDVARHLACRSHPRVVLLRYEDLVDAPFRTVSELLEKLIGRRLEESEIAKRYAANTYRNEQPRLATWGETRSAQVTDCNRKTFTAADRAALRAMSRQRINPDYAKLFGLAEVSFQEAAEAFGYAEDFQRIAEGRGGADDPPPSSPDVGVRIEQARRWLVARRRGEARLRDLAAYLQPVIEIP